ncbi:HAD family hydrolase [Amycolatopsis pigmentata]|uniref:HAD family hydrolase n=1 Tax=Amycolatopsis pigmentata TaxID=450801 RepID=A0ABW5FJ79_9PSEU
MTLEWAVLFDLDGTLVDTEGLLREAQLSVLGELGVPASAVPFDELRGQGVAENLARLCALTSSPIEPHELYARVQRRLLTRLRAGVDPLPGADDLLSALRRERVPCALVSSSYRAVIDVVVPSLARAMFTVTIAGDEVEHPKPHSEPYRVAAARLGVPPGRCVVIEDSSAGIRSGLSAGCVVVAVAPARESVALTVDGLSELTVERLRRLAGASELTPPARGPG